MRAALDGEIDWLSIHMKQRLTHGAGLPHDLNLGFLRQPLSTLARHP